MAWYKTSLLQINAPFVCNKEIRDCCVRSQSWKRYVDPNKTLRRSKYKTLRRSKYILLAHVVGGQNSRIQSLTNRYDENVFGMVVGWYITSNTRKLVPILYTQSEIFSPQVCFKDSGVRRKFPRRGPKHRRNQRRAKGAMPPPKFVENIVILFFERRFSKQNSVIHLKLNILVYTAEYWQYTLPKSVYTFFYF